MKRYILALGCFVVTFVALTWLSPDNHAVVVGTRDLQPGTVLQNSDIGMFVYSWRYRMPKGAISCWFNCCDRAVGHTVTRHVEKYQPLTTYDIK